MSLHYYIDSSLPSAVVSDLVVFFERLIERLIERCPSDSLLSFSLLSASGRLCIDVTLNSSRLRFKESIESASYPVIKRTLENLFKARLAGWRIGNASE